MIRSFKMYDSAGYMGWLTAKLLTIITNFLIYAMHKIFTINEYDLYSKPDKISFEIRHLHFIRFVLDQNTKNGEIGQVGLRFGPEISATPRTRRQTQSRITLHS